MRQIRKGLLSFLVMGMVVAGLSWPVSAMEFDMGCGRNLSLEGFIRQEFAFNVAGHSEENTNISGLQSAYQMWLLDMNMAWSRQLETRMILRMWGDMIYAIRSDSDYFEKYFESSRKNLQWDNDFDQILREFYVTYSTDKFLVRLGKQQIGWGEADGLRLMDVVNPLDARRDFLFYDTSGFEEVRIPKWMLKTELYTGAFGPIADSALELLWNPGDVKEFGELLPPYADTWRAGGIFDPGNYPSYCQKQWGTWGVPVNFVPLPVRFYKQERATAIKNSEWGGRFKLSFADTFMTINYWNGIDSSDNLLLRYRGMAYDPVNGYMSPLLGNPVPLVFEFDRVWKRMKVAGFTLSREMFGVGQLTKQVANPVLRVEALYEFNKHFNTGEMLNPGVPNGLLKLTDYDMLRYMIGFDWNMRIPFINWTKNTFVSGQMFHLHTFGYHGGNQAPRPVPLYSWTFPQDQFYASLLVKTEYMNERIMPSMLAVRDFHTQAMWIKSTLGFRYGDHWRPQIGWLWISRNTHHTQTMGGPGTPIISDNWASFGIFEDRDQVWLRIEYDF